MKTQMEIISMEMLNINKYNYRNFAHTSYLRALKIHISDVDVDNKMNSIDTDKLQLKYN